MDQYLFQHTDHEGDRLFVTSIVRSSTHPGYLIFGSEDSKENEAVAVRHDRHVVQDLYRAIGRWLDDERVADPSNVAQTAADPEPIYTALIRRLVTEEVARVLPLHQAPQAAVPDPYCHIPNCGWGSCNKHPDGCKTCVSDPEPHDVGHAEEPRFICQKPGGCAAIACSDCRVEMPTKRVVTRQCGLCKAPWSDGHGQPGDPCAGPESGEPADHGRLMSELRRAARNAYCPACKHPWADHVVNGCWGQECECKRERP